MEPRISIITLGVTDLQRSWEFYHQGLGFPTTREPHQGIIFLQTTGSCLALYPLSELAADVGPNQQSDRGSFSGITLAHNTKTREEVDQVLQLAEKAGGEIVKAADDTFWGGYSGYFADPDGHLWEVAFGAFEFNEDGSLIIP